MALVCVGADKKLILSLRPAHGCFIANLVGLLRCHFAGRKRLPDLKNRAPRSTARPVSAWYWLFTSKNSAGAVAGSQRYEDRAPAFRIKPIVKAFLHCLDSAFPSHHLVGPDISCSREHTSFQNGGCPSSRRRGLRDKLSQSVIL